MSPNERRNNIYADLRTHRHLTVNYLAEKYGVSSKTIRRDIDELTLTYPIETVRGRYGGGVKLVDWYRPSKKALAPEQISLLKKLAPSLKGDDLVIMNSIISQFAP
jgi:predicted DNA-binding transcriptional regulator YafY